MIAVIIIIAPFVVFFIISIEVQLLSLVAVNNCYGMFVIFFYDFAIENPIRALPFDTWSLKPMDARHKYMSELIE